MVPHSTNESRSARPTSLIAITIAIAAVYFAAAKLGLSLAFVAEQVTAVWPPTGIALVAILLLGFRAWPGVALGALLANLTANAPLAVAAGIAAGNTLEAVAGAWLLRRVGFRLELDRLRDVLALLVLAAGLSTTVSATIGVTSLCLGGLQPWGAFAGLWSVWWLGDALGDLVMAPVLLVGASAFALPRRPYVRAEAAALAVVTVAVSLTVFSPRDGGLLGSFPLHYAIFPVVIWAAMRFRQPGTVSVTVVAAGLAIGCTAQGLGPFAAVGQNVHEGLLMLQLFMAVVAMTGLVLGATVSERDAAVDRVAAEYAELELGAERLRIALDAGRMGVWDWNIATGEVQWSENLAEIHGLSPGSFSGTFASFQALVHPDDRASVSSAIARAVEGGARYEIEFRQLRPDGAVRWMTGKGRVLRDESGRAIRMLGVGTDVTERRRLEEELRARAAELAEGDRRKDEFLGMLAHELRNPLAPLSTALHLLMTDAPDRDRFLAMADRQVKHLSRLVNDLLDLSRITWGKIALEREEVALADLVARALELVEETLTPGGHVLTVSLPPEPVRVDADPVRLIQVIANLLGNAVKYTPPGGSIWLTAERLEDELVIRVRDTGAGLPPELLPRVFDLFVQGDASLDRRRGGLGIGLTIVRGLVEMHGGTVEARSQGVGQGSEFTVRLPASSRGAAAEAPPRPAAARGGGGLRVLVVEDNNDAAESLAMVLELWGNEVQLAYDGTSALGMAERWEPDVILSDLGLPGMDGFELARRLRARPAFGKAVLVALSGYGSEVDRRRAMDSGFDHHVVKPPDLGLLAELLGQVAASVREARPRTLH